MKPQASNTLWSASLLFPFRRYASPLVFHFKTWWFSLTLNRASPLRFPPSSSHSSLSLWGQQHWRTQGISRHLREEANPLCPNFNWATNPPGLSKQWAPSAADNLACPPPCSLLSRAGLGPASVTVSNSGTPHSHRKCELLTKRPPCSLASSLHVTARRLKCVSTNRRPSRIMSSRPSFGNRTWGKVEALKETG